MTRHHTPTQVGLGPIYAEPLYVAEGIEVDVDALARGGRFVSVHVPPEQLPKLPYSVARVPVVRKAQSHYWSTLTAAQWRERARWIEAYLLTADETAVVRLFDADNAPWLARALGANAWEREHRGQP